MRGDGTLSQCDERDGTLSQKRRLRARVIVEVGEEEEGGISYPRPGAAEERERERAAGEEGREEGDTQRFGWMREEGRAAHRGMVRGVEEGGREGGEEERETWLWGSERSETTTHPPAAYTMSRPL
eukprot:1650293-Rhodomonas_salina.1